MIKRLKSKRLTSALWRREHNIHGGKAEVRHAATGGIFLNISKYRNYVTSR